jgi:hypothetical protein
MIILGIFGFFFFRKKKSDAFKQAKKLFKKIQIEQNCSIKRIRSDHERGFENSSIEEFCNFHGIQ